MSLLRGKGSSLVVFNGSTTQQLAQSQGCRNDPPAPVGSGYLLHTASCTESDLLQPPVVLHGELSSRPRRQHLSQHVFREHIFSLSPLVCQAGPAGSSSAGGSSRCFAQPGASPCSAWLRRVGGGMMRKCSRSDPRSSKLTTQK